MLMKCLEDYKKISNVEQPTADTIIIILGYARFNKFYVVLYKNKKAPKMRISPRI